MPYTCVLLLALAQLNNTDTVFRYGMGLPVMAQVGWKALSFILIAVVSGRAAFARVVDNSGAVHPISKSWYIWSLYGANIAGFVAGPVSFHIFLIGVFNDPSTTEASARPL